MYRSLTLFLKLNIYIIVGHYTLMLLWYLLILTCCCKRRGDAGTDEEGEAMVVKRRNIQKIIKLLNKVDPAAVGVVDEGENSKES